MISLIHSDKFGKLHSLQFETLQLSDELYILKLLYKMNLHSLEKT